MRYKTLVLSKLEALQNSISGINSLLAQPSLSKEQFDAWQERVKEKISEIQTLVNVEQESF